MSGTIPAAINLGWRINEEVLWSLDIPVENIPMIELEHNLDICYWESIGTDDWNLTPRQTIENMDYETLHAEKIRNADTTYPIEIYHFKGKRIVLDGSHRLAKLSMEGHQYVAVRKITEDILPLIQKTPEEYLARQGLS